MKTAIHLSYLVVFSLGINVVAAHAETATNTNETAVMEQHGKHEHGVASLSLAVQMSWAWKSVWIPLPPI